MRRQIKCHVDTVLFCTVLWASLQLLGLLYPAATSSMISQSDSVAKAESLIDSPRMPLRPLAFVLTQLSLSLTLSLICISSDEQTFFLILKHEE